MCVAPVLAVVWEPTLPGCLAGLLRRPFLAAAILLVHSRPGDAFGGFVAATLGFFAFLDVLGLALLLVGVTGFVSARHGNRPLFREQRTNGPLYTLPGRSGSTVRSCRDGSGEGADLGFARPLAGGGGG